MQKLEINYISPITNYVFSLKSKYYLIISYLEYPNIIIHKFPINFNNVTNTVRAYIIGQVIYIKTRSKYTIQIFQHDPNNKMTLLFTNVINPFVFEINNVMPIELFPPMTTKSVTFLANESYLSEQFYKYERLAPNNQCVVFFTMRSFDKIGPMLKPIVLPIKGLPKYSSYNKYHETFTIPIDIKLEKMNYDKFIELHQMDMTKYIDKKNTNFNDMFMRKINLQKRPFTHDLTKNNVITCPTDCSIVRVLSDKSFSCEMLPSDYPRVCMPYQGYLVDLDIKFLPNGNISYILNFSNNYYIPNNVGERDYKSVVYGHNVGVTRGYPELVDVQPDTTVYFDIVLIGTNSKESVLVTNEKIQYFEGKKIWLEKGEEIAGFNDCLGKMIVSFNRGVDFEIVEGFNNYVLMNDTIGFLG